MTYKTQGYHEFASFTVTLGCLVENGFDVGMSTFPIFDESYREGLVNKIQAHYWFREIGQETPALFRFMMRRKLNEIMPYYNQIYLSTLEKIEPLRNYYQTVENNAHSTREDERTNRHDENVETTSKGESDTTSTSNVLVSNTPQTQLAGYEDYATNITKSDSDSKAVNVGEDMQNRTLTENDVMSSNAHENYVQHISGLTGITAARAIMEFRESLINVDMMVIDALAPLFIGIYSVNTNYL